MRKLCITIILFMLLFMALPSIAFAQDDGLKTIAYGETVTGEVTSREFEIDYVFGGKAKDVIAVFLVRDTSIGDLSSPAIILLDADYNVLSSNDGYGSVTLIYELPSDGEYHLLATRNGGRAGSSIGGFEMTLLNPAELLPGEPFEASIGRDEKEYFLVRTEGDFSLTYEYLSGTYTPRVNVSIIDQETGELLVIAALEGLRLGSGQLNVDTTELDTSSYIVFVGSPSTYYYVPSDAVGSFSLLLETE
ncbi:MAG: hypothetical protein HY862_14855 [Chloroflexi bacterium]|nr:hypothetical protein [Chloroflexota bacterium]